MQDSLYIQYSDILTANGTSAVAATTNILDTAANEIPRTAFDGIMRNKDLFFGDITALSIIVALVAGGIFLSLLIRGSGKLPEKIDGFISGQRNFTIEWDFAAAYFAFLGLCGYSLFSIICFADQISPTSTWRAAMEISIYFIIKLTLSCLYSKTFFKNSRNSMARLQTSYFAAGGISALILSLFINYSPFEWLYTFIAIFSLSQAILSIVFFTIMYIKFFASTRLVFEYILYLCTLEMLPAVALLQVLKRTLLIY